MRTPTTTRPRTPSPTRSRRPRGARRSCRALPEPGAKVLDAGAGTGALSLLAAELGYDVTALDLSEGMLSKARAKAEAAGVELTFVVGSAAEPPPGPFDAIMERHVLWTMPDPVKVLRAWRDVSAPGGRLVLFEGLWGADTLTQKAKDGPRTRYDGPRVHEHHHAPYPDDVLSQLPLARMTSPVPLIEMVRDAGGAPCASNGSATSSGPRCSTNRGRSDGWSTARATRWSPTPEAPATASDGCGPPGSC